MKSIYCTSLQLDSQAESTTGESHLHRLLYFVVLHQKNNKKKTTTINWKMYCVMFW